MVTIGDKHFTAVEEVRAPKKYDSLYEASDRYEGAHLLDVYARFSGRKAAVWNEWKNYLIATNDLSGCWICSHNTAFFTIAFDVEYMGRVCRAYITPSYNYLLIPA